MRLTKLNQNHNPKLICLDMTPKLEGRGWKACRLHAEDLGESSYPACSKALYEARVETQHVPTATHEESDAGKERWPQSSGALQSALWPGITLIYVNLREFVPKYDKLFQVRCP